MLRASEVDPYYNIFEAASLEQGPGIHREYECSVVPRLFTAMWQTLG